MLRTTQSAIYLDTQIGSQHSCPHCHRSLTVKVIIEGEDEDVVLSPERIRKKRVTAQDVIEKMLTMPSMNA